MENEEKQLEQQPQTSTTVAEPEKETKVGLEGLNDLPRIEDLLRSEKEVKTSTGLKGLKEVEAASQNEDKAFTLKKDENKSYVKKRVKVATCVYVSVLALLFLFVFSNAITLAVLSRDIHNNANTIQSEAQNVSVWKEQGANDAAKGEFTVSLNEPRDYSDDTKELTFFDKLSILFRNLFG